MLTPINLRRRGNELGARIAGAYSKQAHGFKWVDNTLVPHDGVTLQSVIGVQPPLAAVATVLVR